MRASELTDTANFEVMEASASIPRYSSGIHCGRASSRQPESGRRDHTQWAALATGMKPVGGTANAKPSRDYQAAARQHLDEEDGPLVFAHALSSGSKGWCRSE